MKRLIVFLLLALAVPLFGESSLVLHSYSHHFAPANVGMNAWNLGIGYRTGGPTWSGQIGTYRNSHYRWSAYGLVDYQPVQIWRVSAGAFVGTVNHYAANDGQPIFAGGLVGQWRMPRQDIRVRFVPRYRHFNKAVLSLEVGWRL